MIALIRKLFWIVLFCVFTVGFVTLFDHGFTSGPKFIQDGQGEVNDFIGIWKPVKREKDQSDKIVP